MTPESSGTAIAPTTETERIHALDALRGIAVLGILLMNIVAFGLPGAYMNPANSGGAEGANLWAWITAAMFFEGTMRGLFTLLFGAGVVLYTSRLERAGLGLVSADFYFRRTLWLIVFGLVNAYLLLWEGDILFFYGLVGLFLFVFRHLPPRRLLAFAIPLLCVQTISGIHEYREFQALQAKATAAEALQAQGQSLSEEQQEDIEAFAKRRAFEQPSAEEKQEVIDARRGSYASAFAENAKVSFWMETEFLARWGFWECLGMMLLGMALMKSGALTAQWPASRYWKMLVVGWAIGYLVNTLEIAHQVRTGFAVDSVLSANMVTYDLGRIPLTLGHLAFVMLLVKAGVFRRAFDVLAKTGQMALTNYLAQSVICMFLFTGAGLGLYGQFERHQLYYVVLAIWALQLAWSPWWLARYRYGPMEWLWRSLTRWQKQTVGREAPALSPTLSR